MNYVHGKIELNVAIPVESTEESMALLEANYKIRPERIVAYKLTLTDCKGVEHEIIVDAAIGEFDLAEFIEIA